MKKMIFIRLGAALIACSAEIAYSYCNADRSVRDARYRYIVWKGGSTALYDHLHDLGENYTLAGNPEVASVVKHMQ